MTIEPAALGSAIALVLGRDPDTALLGELARVLARQEEVLPWLVLRQHAFDDDPEILDRLRALAAAGNRPSRHRPDGPVQSPAAYALKRDVEAALGAMIAENVASADRADGLGALLHAHNRTLPGRPDYDFRRRIVERGPLAAIVPEDDDASAAEPAAGTISAASPDQSPRA